MIRPFEETPNSSGGEIIRAENKSNQEILNTSNLSSLKVEFCNIRSIANKVDLVKSYISAKDIDLLFLTETWLCSKISNSICPNGYNVIRSDRQHLSGGGVLLFYKKELPINVVKHMSPCVDTPDPYEVLCVDYLDQKEPIRFCCFYVPPRSSLRDKVVDNVCQVISSVHSPSQPLFILGDFNLPQINWEKSTSTGGKSHNVFLNYCIDNCLCQCVNEPTHDKNNILDLLLCNTVSRNLLLSTTVDPPLSSSCDHAVVSFVVNLKGKVTTNTANFRLDFEHADYTVINSLIQDYLNNWNFYTTDPSKLQSVYDNFINFLLKIIDQNVPKKYFKKQKPKIPFFIKKLLKQKLSLYRKSKANKELLSEYKIKSKQYDQAVKAWHNKAESNICRNPSSKKFYSFFKKKLNYKSSIPPLLDQDNNINIFDIDKANCLNSFFNSVFSNDDGSNVVQDNDIRPHMENFVIQSSEVASAIKDLNDKISRTPENIPSYFIKRISSSIISFLVFLFNSSLQFNFIPDQWKKSIIIPIHKKGDLNRPQNYRPISLTSGFSRLLESIIRKKILQHFISNNLFSKNQFGFLPLRSSCSQLLKCIHDWYSNLISKKSTHIIYTDIAKAFDVVNHRKLISVVKSYGVSSSLVNWLANFLENRTQQVAINQSLSSSTNVTSGVPQGSIVGPLLFLIYINSIDKCTSNLQETGGLSLFADDTKVYSNNPLELQASSDRMGLWLEDYQLPLALNKCYTLHINCSSNQPIFNINNTIINSTNQIKDLGIIICDSLKWSAHINYLYKNASNSSYHITKFSKTTNIWTLLKLYTTYIRPKLEYNTPIWSPNLAKDIKKIEQIQKNFTRFAFKKCKIPYSSYSNRLYQLNIKSLEYRRVYFDVIFMFKILNGLSGLNPTQFFKLRPQSYQLRQNKLKIDTINRSNNSLWANSFFVRGTKLWNALPSDLRSITEIERFKQRFKKIDLNKITKLIFQ